LPHIVDVVGILILYDADNDKANSKGQEEAEEGKKSKKDETEDKPCGEAVQPEKSKTDDEAEEAEADDETDN